MKEIKDELTKIFSAAIKAAYPKLDKVSVTIEKPKDPKHGDFAVTSAMQLAKELKTNPFEIAENIATEVSKNVDSQVISSIETVKPGFINIKLNKEVFNSVLLSLVKDKPRYYLEEEKENSKKNIIIEFSSPNIAKPFTIGHLRSTVIGDAIARMYEYLGYTVFRDNHLGDWGASFGKYLAAFEEYGTDLESIKKSEEPVKELVEIYIKFNSDSEKNPNLKEKAREWFKKLEEGDSKARDYWKECIDITFIEFNQIYNLLDIRFTENEGRGYGESYFEEEMKLVIKDLEDASKKGIIDYKKSEGAWLVFFDKSEKLPPLMIIKSNGTTLYSTRDLATDRFRKNKKEYGYPNLTVVNEVGKDQDLYWRQIFNVEEKLGWYKKGQRVHVSHGLYKFEEGKMSTRKGNVIWLEDILNRAISKAKEVSEGSNTISESELDSLSEKIGIGAIKWNDLKRDSDIDILFDWDEILNLKGNSGPYVQYTYTRALSILKKVTKSTEFISGLQPKDIEVDSTEQEENLIELISEFNDTVLEAAQKYSPNTLCNYIYQLAQEYNSFYANYKVLDAETKELKNFRLALTKAVADTLEKGLNLLGIEVVEKM